MNVRPEIGSVDKLPCPDLATAPLGTDEEAAGAPAMHKEIAHARSDALAAKPMLSNACSFFVVVIVLICATLVVVGGLVL